MEILVFGVIIAIIVLCGMHGRKEGLVRMALSMIATIASMIITSLIHTPVYEYIKDRFGIMKKIKAIVGESLEDIKLEDISYIEEMQLPDALKEKIIEGAKSIEDPIKDYVIESVASVALSSIIYVLLFIIVSIMIKVIIDLADIVAKLPIISEANKGAGLVAGLIYGIFVIWIAMMVLTALSSTAIASDILLVIGNNKILSFIYDSNPLTGILSKAIEGIR